MSNPSAVTPTDFPLEDGTRLHAVQRGASAPEMTVLLAHGYALDHRSWHRQFDALEAATEVPVRIVAYDHRGHGRSDPAGENTATIEQLGDDMADVLEHSLPEHPVVIVGHSMGGMAMMALAERHPRLFHRRAAGLVFASTTAGRLAETALYWPKPLGKLVQDLERGFGPAVRSVRRHIEPMKTAGLRRWLFGQQPGEDDVALTADMVWTQWPDTVALFRPAFDRYDRTAALTVASNTPVTAVVGDEDKLCPAAHAEALAQHCTNGQHTVFAGAGHMLPLERPAEVTRSIADAVDAARAQ